MSNPLIITIDREELSTRVGNLGVTYAALSGIGVSPEDIATITNDIDEAFIDGLIEYTEELDESLKAAELIGYALYVKDTETLETFSIFGSEQHVQDYLSAWKPARLHQNYDITPIYREKR